MSETNTIDLLFLELSQFTKATTARELSLLKAIKPFAELVLSTSGRIPTERLSLADWHALAKAYSDGKKGDQQ